MSSHIHDLKEGDTLSFKGPFVKWKWEPNQFKSIALIGGGSGITPLYQLLHAITSNPEDKTKVQLFYGNLSPDDILIKDRLDEIAKNNKDQVNITYFVNDKKGKDFDGVEGFITKDFCKRTWTSQAWTQRFLFVDLQVYMMPSQVTRSLHLIKVK